MQFISNAITPWYRRPFSIIAILALATVVGGWFLARWGETQLRERLAAADGAPPLSFASARFRLFPPRVELLTVKVESPGAESLTVNRALTQFTWRSLLRRHGIPAATLIHLDGVRWTRSAPGVASGVTHLKAFLARAGVPSVDRVLVTAGAVVDARGSAWLTDITLQGDPAHVRLRGQLFEGGELDARVTPGLAPAGDRAVSFNAERLALPHRRGKAGVTAAFRIKQAPACAVEGTFQTSGAVVTPLDLAPLNALADQLAPDVEVHLASVTSTGQETTRPVGPVGLTGSCRGENAPVQSLVLSYLSRIILAGLGHSASPTYVYRDEPSPQDGPAGPYDLSN